MLSSMTSSTVLGELRRVIVQQGSQKAAAAHLGVSAAYLSDVLRDRREPGPKLLSALGMKRTVTYDKLKGGKR